MTSDPNAETRAELRRLLAEMDGVWKETPAVKVVSLMLQHGPALLDEIDAYERFHDAWTEHQCGLATGDPEIAREKGKALMEAQRAVLSLKGREIAANE